MLIKNHFRLSRSLFLIYSVGAILNFCFIESGEDKTPIYVRLSSENHLVPIYLGNLDDEKQNFTTDYINKLDKILNFDLNHNGKTFILERSKDNESQLLPFESYALSSTSYWKDKNIYYVIKTSIINRSISACILSVNGQTVKCTGSLPLSGTLAEDRRQIHILSDAIHKAVFDSDGIASTRIIYTIKSKSSKTKQWISEVWESDYDGENARQITLGDNYCVTPVCIPPKPGFSYGNIIYVSYQIGQPKIYVASLKDGNGKRIISLRGNQLMPVISMQRDQIAFISDISGNPDLFLQKFSPESGAIGKPRQIFSSKQATQGSPAFSPDGQKIAFVSDKDGSPRIYIMDIPSENASIKDLKPFLITKYCRESSAPSWSPDGTKIAFCGKTQGVRQIWVYDFNRREEKQITQGPGNKENPTWAPNSLHLIFNSTDADSSELYMINLNQHDAVKISTGPGEKRYPNWEPRPKN